ncbi:MAG: pyridoxamine 5'-phosphate oxidase family protein [Paracoccaceae bacterium]
MAKQFPALDEAKTKFIETQHMFFCGSAGPEGRVNISPKGMDSLRVIGPNRIIWMNITGSGNETAGHLLENPRMTLMWCSFETRPMILRCYGTATTTHVGDPGWDELSAQFPAHRSARQIYDLDIDLVQTSCGYAVPFMDFAKDRDTMQKWVDDKSDDQIQQYWTDRNTMTIDGKPTWLPAGE